MKANWYDYPLLFASLATYLALFTRLCLQPRWRKWRGLISLSFLECVKSSYTLLYDAHAIGYAPYYYAYWTAAALLSLAGVAVLYDTLRAIPLGQITAPFIRWTLTSFTVAAAAFAIAISLAASPKTGIASVNVVMQLDHSVSLLWAAAAAGLMVYTSVNHLGWPPIALRIGTSFAARIALSVLCTQLAKGAHRETYALIYYWHDWAATAISAYWLWLVHQPMQDPAPLQHLSPKVALFTRIFASLRPQQ